MFHWNNQRGPIVQCCVFEQVPVKRRMHHIFIILSILWPLFSFRGMCQHRATYYEQAILDYKIAIQTHEEYVIYLIFFSHVVSILCNHAWFSFSLLAARSQQAYVWCTGLTLLNSELKKLRIGAVIDYSMEGLNFEMSKVNNAHHLLWLLRCSNTQTEIDDLLPPNLLIQDITKLII